MEEGLYRHQEKWDKQHAPPQERLVVVDESLETIEDDFGAKRGMIEALDVWVALTMEDGE